MTSLKVWIVDPEAIKNIIAMVKAEADSWRQRGDCAEARDPVVEAEFHDVIVKMLETLAAPVAPVAVSVKGPVTWQWLHYDPISGDPVWHNEQFRNGHTSTFSRPLYTDIPPDSYAAMWERQAKTIGELQNEIECLKKGPSLNDRATILTENFDQDHNIAIRRAAIEDVLGLLTGHELYRYRPKAFNGFIEYARTELAVLSSIIPATKGGEEPAAMHQMAEERLCTCGAAGSGEGHVDWCDWQSSEWRKWGDAFNATTHSDATELLVRAAKTVIAAFDGMQPHHLPHNGERALALLGQALAALAQDTDATPPVAPTGTVGRDDNALLRAELAERLLNLAKVGFGYDIKPDDRDNLRIAAAVLSAPTVEGEGL